MQMVAATGSLRGEEVYMEVEFPSTYPAQPPRVKLLTKISHPNVYGDWLCLDMIKVRMQRTLE